MTLHAGASCSARWPRGARAARKRVASGWRRLHRETHGLPSPEPAPVSALDARQCTPAVPACPPSSFLPLPAACQPASQRSRSVDDLARNGPSRREQPHRRGPPPRLTTLECARETRLSLARKRKEAVARKIGRATHYRRAPARARAVAAGSKRWLARDVERAGRGARGLRRAEENEVECRKKVPFRYAKDCKGPIADVMRNRPPLPFLCVQGRVWYLADGWHRRC